MALRAYYDVFTVRDWSGVRSAALKVLRSSPHSFRERGVLSILLQALMHGLRGSLQRASQWGNRRVQQ